MRGRNRFDLLMQFTQDQKQLFSEFRFGIGRGKPSSLVDLLFIEMDLNERETHRKQEKRSCEQKQRIADDEGLVHCRPFKRVPE
jgi:hypothetical protein